MIAPNQNLVSPVLLNIEKFLTGAPPWVLVEFRQSGMYYLIIVEPTKPVDNFRLLFSYTGLHGKSQ